MSGWIKVHRDILAHWVSAEPELLAMFIRLVLDASYKDKKVMFNKSLVEIKRGQLIFGRVSFSEKSGISERKLRRYLKMMEADQVIDQVVTARYTLITIRNYEKYQESDQVIDQQASSERPASDQQVTTTKEVKEYKEREEDIYGKSKIPPCPHDEIIDLWGKYFPAKVQPRKNLWDGSRRVNLNTRWKQHYQLKNNNNPDWDGQKHLEWFDNFFKHLSGSEFLVDRFEGFTLDWLTQKKNWIKAVEGNYT